ncbi:3236_t:CDS:2, partial [Dentiscutata erythropus]
MYRYRPCPRCGDTFTTNQKFKYYLTERKHPCAPRNILQATVPVSSSELLSNLDSQFQVIKDPNARKSGESVKQWRSRLRKKVKELGNKDCVQPKINESETRGYASPEAGPGPRTQSHHEGKLIKSEEIVTQQTTLLDNIELQP